MTILSRRSFLASATVGAAALGGPFAALRARPAAARPGGGRRRFDPGYGPLAPVKDQATGLELLWLPKGFEYVSYGWTGDPMSDGVTTPSSHDGMAAFRLGDRVHLVRNHERRERLGAYTEGPFTYDPASG